LRRMSEGLNRISFHVKWLFWNPNEKYLYLWNRTCDNNKSVFATKIGRFTGKEV
jgi:hypothetical protein